MMVQHAGRARKHIQHLLTREIRNQMLDECSTVQQFNCFKLSSNTFCEKMLAQHHPTWSANESNISDPSCWMISGQHIGLVCVDLYVHSSPNVNETSNKRDFELVNLNS